MLSVLVAILLVGDVGVRRVRVSMPELKAGYRAVRRRLGYIDDPAELRPRTPTSISEWRQDPGPAVGPATLARGAPARSPTAGLDTQSARLLAARRRASRR
jgi:hypothetical protein